MKPCTRCGKEEVELDQFSSPNGAVCLVCLKKHYPWLVRYSYDEEENKKMQIDACVTMWDKMGDWTLYKAPEVFGNKQKEEPVNGMMTFYINIGNNYDHQQIAKLINVHKERYITQKVIDRLEKQGILCVFIPVRNTQHYQEFVNFGK